jgi:hydrogenase expression/formation protein HypE
MNEDQNISKLESFVCPVPLKHDKKILLGHGSGGKMMNDLIRRTFLPPLTNPILDAGNDAGVTEVGHNNRLAISTDAHVVDPLFFPGGDIGKLAICGTVNDVSMVGASPKFLTASFILEEGLNIDILEAVVQSMREAAEESGVEIVAGDTKVVQKTKADGLYISTTGVGTFLHQGIFIGGDQAKPGDIVILSGTIGDHGIAVLTARGELGLHTDIQSDVAPLNHLVCEMLDESKRIHVLRDPTRGGVASTLNEIAEQSQVGIVINENTIPVRPSVQAACEILGFDPLYIANEGKLIAVVAKSDAASVLARMRNSKYGIDAAIIGEITESPAGTVLMKTNLGSTRVLDVLTGEMLPRIC